VIVEGYLDVIALHQGGFSNVVSPMGTALTEDQLKMLKRLTRRIVLALDPDAAGQKATLRGLELARQAMDHTEERTYDPSGLLRQQARLDADLRVTTLPEGMDPDEIVLRDPTEWARIVESAKPLLTHVMETLVAGQNIDDPKIKGEIAAQVLPLIEDVPNSFEREDYRQRLARLLRVDERSLVGVNPPARAARRHPTSQKPATSEAAKKLVFQNAIRPEEALEVHCLRLLLRQPDMLYLLDRALQKAGVSRFSVQDFEHADHQVLAGVIFQSLEQDDQDVNQYIQESLPEPLRDLAHELLEPFAQGDPSPERIIEDLVQTVMRLRQIRTRAHVDQLIFMQRDVQQEEGSRSMDDYQGIHQVVLQCTRVLKNLNKALGQPVQLD
jgi:DNA primase